MIFLCWSNRHNLNVNFDEKFLLRFKKFSKKIKLHQFLKNWDLIRTKKHQKTFLDKKMNKKNNSTKILTS